MVKGRGASVSGAGIMRGFAFAGLVLLTGASQLWALNLVTPESPPLAVFLLACGPVFLAMAVISIYSRTEISHQLSRLTKAAERAASGDHSAIETVSGVREVRELGSAISNMSSYLRKNMAQAFELAYVDRTTELPNREFFRKELTRAISKTIRKGSTGALLFVDLDGFKHVNDTYGHDVGDMVLHQVSRRLTNILRAEDLIGLKPGVELAQSITDEEGDESQVSRQMLARLGGDEFTVLLTETREATDAAIVSRRIIDVISQPFDIHGTQLSVGASIGIATFPHDGSDYQTILKSADMAMYKAKGSGKNTYRFYSETLNEEAARRGALEAGLREAVRSDNELVLHYQPKIDLEQGKPTAVEALLRWNHPRDGMRSPDSFLDVAESCGLMPTLGTWVVEEACRQIVKLEACGFLLPVSVNISIGQFEQADFADVVQSILAKTGAKPEMLNLELAEKVLMHNPDVVFHHITILKELGVTFSIDDFGVGSSNLKELCRLPLDQFKIDCSVIHLLDGDEAKQGATIFRTIMAVADSFGYETVAVGVETERQLRIIEKHGCRWAQGYYFAHPMPEEHLHDWLVTTLQGIEAKEPDADVVDPPSGSQVA